MKSETEYFQLMNEQTLEDYKKRNTEELQKLRSGITNLISQAQAEIFQINLNSSQVMEESQKNKFISHLKNEIQNYRLILKNEQDKIFNDLQQFQRILQQNNKKKEQQQLIREFAIIISLQQTTTRFKELQNVRSAAWMKQLKPIQQIKCQKIPEVQLEVALNPNTKITINNLVDSAGNQFKGPLKIKSYTCDSIKEPEKLNSFPSLLMLSRQDPQSLPTSKLISLSMKENQFQNSDGKLVFLNKPIQVNQSLSTEIKPESLKYFKAYRYDYLEERWIDTGPIHVSEDGKSIKYEMQTQSKNEMIKAFEMIGQPRKITTQKQIYNLDMIKQIHFVAQEVKQLYEQESKSEQIKYEIQSNNYKKDFADSLADQKIQQLRSYSEMLQKIKQDMKVSSKTSLFYEKVCQYFIKKKETTKIQNPGQNQQDLIYIPKSLRNVSKQFLYNSLIRLNKESVPYRSTQIFVQSGQYQNYLDEDSLNAIQKFELYQKDQKDPWPIKEIFIESPNKKFRTKFILVHPKIKLFFRDSFLQSINSVAQSEKFIQDLNSDAMNKLKQKLKAWSQKNERFTLQAIQSIKRVQTLRQKRQMKEWRKQGDQYPLRLILEEEADTIAELIVESKLQKVKLISTNKFMMRLELAILFSLSKQSLFELEREIRLVQNNSKYQQKVPIKLKRINEPLFLKPKQQFLNELNSYFKRLAEENDKTINSIIHNRVKNSIELPDNFLMEKVQNPEAQIFLNETEKAFDEALAKGLFNEEECKRMKETKVNKIKKSYLSDGQWKKNQNIVQRIIAEIFPSCEYSSKSYSELVSNLDIYCKTRAVLGSQSDINNFEKIFLQKYYDYIKEQPNGLVGGTRKWNDLYYDIQRVYGPAAAIKSMGSICNVDSNRQLTQSQILQYSKVAQDFKELQELQETVPYKFNKTKQNLNVYKQNVQRKQRQTQSIANNTKSKANEKFKQYNDAKDIQNSIKNQERNIDEEMKNKVDKQNLNTVFSAVMPPFPPPESKNDDSFPTNNSSISSLISEANQTVKQFENNVSKSFSLNDGLRESQDDEKILEESINEPIINLQNNIDKTKAKLKQEDKKIQEQQKKKQVDYLKNTKARNRRLQQMRNQVQQQKNENRKMIDQTLNNSLKKIFKQ